MYLYEKRENEICIYELVSNDEKLRKFREDELKKQENIFWYAKTYKTKENTSHKNMKSDQRKIVENKLFENITQKLKKKELNSNNHKFYSNNDQNSDSKLFIDYCTGKYDLYPTITIYADIFGYSPENKKLCDEAVKRHDELAKIFGANYAREHVKFPDKELLKTVEEYLVLTEPNYHEVNMDYTPYTYYYMNNIISIPKSLYLLNMFLQGNIDEISKENIDTQLGFFALNPKPVLTVSLEYLEKLIQCNLVRYADNMDALFDSHQKILKKLR